MNRKGSVKSTMVQRKVSVSKTKKSTVPRVRSGIQKPNSRYVKVKSNKSTSAGKCGGGIKRGESRGSTGHVSSGVKKSRIQLLKAEAKREEKRNKSARAEGQGQTRRSRSRSRSRSN